MPTDVVIAMAVLLGVLMLFVLPRFWTRLRASVNRKVKVTDASKPHYQTAYAFNMEQRGEKPAEESTKIVAGGDLKNGWFLRRGKGVSTIGEPELAPKGYGHRFSTFEGHIGDTRAPRSEFTPPPHVQPLAERSNVEKVLGWAPFSRWPFPMNTRANLVELAVICIYIAINIFAATWKSDVRDVNPKTGLGSDYKRTGVVAMAQTPFVIALGVRGNIVGLLLGKSYDHLRIIHKVAGRVVVFAGVIHSCFFINAWAQKGKLASSAASPVGVTGFIAFAALLLIFVTSLPIFRRWAYNLFRICHFIGIVAFLAGLGAHVEGAVPWCVAAGVIYASSLVIQLFKTRVATAELMALGGCSTTVVTVPSITTGWRPGQHVRLRVLGMGPTKIMEAHPFTIASAPDCGGLVLLAKAAGDWTTQLYGFAANGAQTDREVGLWKRSVKVMIEGPYGGLGNTLPNSFSSVLVVAGGSGISHALGLAQDLVSRSPSGSVAARTVDLVWVVRTEKIAQAMMPTLLSLVAQARRWEARALEGRRQGADLAVPTALRVHIFVTRVPASSPMTLVPAGYRRKLRRLTMPPSKELQFMEASEAYAESALSEDGKDGKDVLSDSDSGSSEGGPWVMSEHGHGGRSGDWVELASELDHGTGSTTFGRKPSVAEKTKADWLARNPSNVSVARLHARRTDASAPMSSVSTYRGRPDVGPIVTTIADEVMQQHHQRAHARGMLVTTCGPEHLVNDTRDACRAVPGWKKSGVGGLEFEAEFFAF